MECKLLQDFFISTNSCGSFCFSSFEVPWFCLTRGYFKREMRNSANIIANGESSKIDPGTFKGTLSGLRQFLATESSLKMMKNVFYFISKVLFLLKLFKFWT